jgi:PBP1b-binding outer membrane lipoprotein LpoB
MKNISGLIAALAVALLLAGCAGAAGMGEVHGNEGGSTPINETEIPQYQKAVNRCHKTGGTRVVKIDGVLRCF